MQIGELLVALGLTTREQLRAALENQAIFGGRIGTNLLELGAVSEEALAETLGRRFGVPARSGPLEVAREALALLRPEVAARLEVVPAAVHGKTLEVLVANPADLARLDEIAFATGKQVRPIVVAEARLVELLRRHYGVERVLRGLGVPYLPRAEPAADAAPGASGDLMAEDLFATLYVSRAEGGDAAVARARATSAARDEARDDGPLSASEALAALAVAHDRDALGHVLLRAARARFRRAALLEVGGEHATGWDAVGHGVDPAAIRALRLRLRDAGIVGTVVRTRAHVLGPLLRTEQNVRLLAALGAGEPANGFGMPILARGRVAFVLYADDDADGVVEGEGLGDLLIVAARVGAAYEALAASVPS